MKENLYKAAVLILEHKNANAPFLFSNLKISYTEALELINELEKVGVLGPFVENEERRILIEDLAVLDELFPEDKNDSRGSLILVEKNEPKFIHKKISKIEELLDGKNSKGDKNITGDERRLLLAQLKRLKYKLNEKAELKEGESQKINKNLSDTKIRSASNRYKTLFYIMLCFMVLLIFVLMSIQKTKKSLINKEKLLKSQVDDLEFRNSNLLSSNVERRQENENLKNEVSILKLELERAPNTTVSAADMQVLYRGLNNKIKVSASGYKPESITISCSGCSIISSLDEYGNFFAKAPSGIGKEAFITVSAIDDNGNNVELTKERFRIFNLPKPTVYFGGKAGGSMKKVDALQIPSLRANLSESPLYVPYEVTEFVMLTVKNGQPIRLKSKGSRLSLEMKNAIKKINKGGSLTFTGVKVKGPSGKEQPLDAGLILTLK